jgi:hypothetical protein
MLEVLFLNSFLSALEVQLHRLTRLEAVDLLVLCLAVCKLCHMSLNPLVETTDILIITVVPTEVFTLLATLTVNHILKVNLHSSNLQYQCTTADRQQLEAMEALDHSNLS